MGNYLTIDIGGTNIKYAVMDEEINVKEKGEMPTPYDGLDVYLDTLKSIYDKYVAYDIKAIAMSAPGRINSNNGYFYTSGHLKYADGINLKEKLEEILPIEVFVENDAKCAALAELWKGSMKGVKNGIVLVIGTGVGGGIILDGKVYRGSTFASGEFSFMPTNFEENKFSFNSMWGVKNGIKPIINEYANLTGLNPENIDGRMLFDRANKEDSNALKALERYCSSLACGIFSLQLVLDVEKIAIGGGISRQPLLLETLKKALKSYVGESSTLIPATMPEIVACEYGNDANLIGALYNCLNNKKEN